jgi:hypothetical protein
MKAFKMTQYTPPNLNEFFAELDDEVTKYYYTRAPFLVITAYTIADNFKRNYDQLEKAAEVLQNTALAYVEEPSQAQMISITGAALHVARHYDAADYVKQMLEITLRYYSQDTEG